ncbi:hypothetical protein BH23BAC3_BH23BAC3_20110 [soil metagenome]
MVDHRLIKTYKKVLQNRDFSQILRYSEIYIKTVLQSLLESNSNVFMTCLYNRIINEFYSKRFLYS